jgi:hypothetical protein
MLVDLEYLRDRKVPQAEQAYELAVDSYIVAQNKWDDLRDSGLSEPAWQLEQVMLTRDAADRQYDQALQHYREACAEEFEKKLSVLEAVYANRDAAPRARWAVAA